MKRLGVAGIITGRSDRILMGRRAKDPNRGLFVFPGGGVEDGETLEQAFCREVKEETGYEVIPDPNRWNKPLHLIELPDRIVLFAEGSVLNYNDEPIANSDLEGVEWFYHMPEDISPAVKSVWASYKELKDKSIKASYYDPYDDRYPSAW